MTDDQRIGRSLTAEEIAVIRAALERAAVNEVIKGAGFDLGLLSVIDRCSCGCDSVYFEKNGQGPRSMLVADGIGTTSAGGQVGVIVWGRGKAITGLEIYDLGAGENDLKLPIPSSIKPFPSADSTWTPPR